MATLHVTSDALFIVIHFYQCSILCIIALLYKPESSHYLILAVAPTRAQAYTPVIICVGLLRGLLLLCAVAE